MQQVILVLTHDSRLPAPDSYPWRCLKRGFFLLITYSLPLRRTILQSTLRFLMDALTFIFLRF